MSFFKDEEGPVGKDWDGMAGMEREGMESIDVQKRMKDERKLIEERKKLTGGETHDEESDYKVSFLVMFSFSFSFPSPLQRGQLNRMGRDRLLGKRRA